MILYPNVHLKSVLEITIEFLHKNQINALILDVDNTLIDYDKNLQLEIIEWAKNLKANNIKLYILSNTNKKEKVKTVAEKLKIEYMYFAKKPLKTGFKKIQEKLQETKSEIERVKYYEKFKMQGIDFKNIFITEEKDVDGNISYHIYSGDSSNEIMSVNEKGEVNVISELEAFIGNDIDVEKIMEENEKEPGKLRGISEKTKPKEIDKKLKEKQNQKEDQEENIQDVEELSEELEDLELTNYRKIKDDNLDKQMKGKFKGAEEKGTAYSKKLNAFIIVEKVDGKLQKADGFEPAKPTMKKVISINEDGTEVEQTAPHALIKTDNPKKELSITIGQYGYIETATVDRLPCNERVQMQLREEGEGVDAKRSKQLRDLQLKGRKRSCS